MAAARGNGQQYSVTGNMGILIIVLSFSFHDGNRVTLKDGENWFIKLTSVQRDEMCPFLRTKPKFYCSRVGGGVLNILFIIKIIFFNYPRCAFAIHSVIAHTSFLTIVATRSINQMSPRINQ